MEDYNLVAGSLYGQRAVGYDGIQRVDGLGTVC